MKTLTIPAMDKHIVDFISAQTVMTLATSHNNTPHCAMCFYVFLEDLNSIVFKSKPSTQHVTEGLANNIVAGSILPDKFNPGKTSGIQFTGRFQSSADISEKAAKHYYKKYPFAAVVPGDIWVIELDTVIFTDATLGFGKKRNWQR